MINRPEARRPSACQSLVSYITARLTFRWKHARPGSFAVGQRSTGTSDTNYDFSSMCRVTGGATCATTECSWSPLPVLRTPSRAASCGSFCRHDPWSCHERVEIEQSSLPLRGTGHLCLSRNGCAAVCLCLCYSHLVASADTVCSSASHAVLTVGENRILTLQIVADLSL